MAKRAGDIVRTLKTVDDICRLVTGKRLSRLVATGVDLFGEDLWKKIRDADAHLDLNSPYYLLGVHEDAPDVVVKAAYRALARDLHPDTGARPDSARFQKVTEAYQTIMKDRAKA